MFAFHAAPPAAYDPANLKASYTRLSPQTTWRTSVVVGQESLPANTAEFSSGTQESDEYGQTITENPADLGLRDKACNEIGEKRKIWTSKTQPIRALGRQLNVDYLATVWINVASISTS